jgi:2-C-methyl-D-erythritol 4-phosphate cytidylyltransferase
MSRKNSPEKCWVVIPAAGIGKRFDKKVAKQYTYLDGKTILEHSITPFLQGKNFSGILVAISEGDKQWKNLSFPGKERIISITGGNERFHSVYNALDFLANDLSDEDWVITHDAARPCLTLSLIRNLQQELSSHPVGGLVAMPIKETIKQADEQSNIIKQTLDRRHLWSAQTPQMFRYGILFKAFRHCMQNNIEATDEAMAVESIGYEPKIILGSPRNIKITLQEDFGLAETFKKEEQNV